MSDEDKLDIIAAILAAGCLSAPASEGRRPSGARAVKKFKAVRAAIDAAGGLAVSPGDEADDDDPRRPRARGGHRPTPS